MLNPTPFSQQQTTPEADRIYAPVFLYLMILKTKRRLLRKKRRRSITGKLSDLESCRCSSYLNYSRLAYRRPLRGKSRDSCFTGRPLLHLCRNSSAPFRGLEELHANPLMPVRRHTTFRSQAFYASPVPWAASGFMRPETLANWLLFLLMPRPIYLRPRLCLYAGGCRS